MTLVAQRPGPGFADAYRFPTVQRRRLGRGEIVAADLPGRPLASISLLLPRGAAEEPSGLEGVTQLTARMLSEGTTRRSAEEFALAVEALGVNFGAGASWDTVRVNLSGPVERLDRGIELFGEAFRTPRLATDDVLHVRDERVQSLRMAWSQPGTRGRRAFRRQLHGSASRYGAAEGGDQYSNAAIEPDHARALHARWLDTPATLIVAGDLDRIDLDALADAVFTAGSGATVGDADALSLERPHAHVVLVDRPGAVQSSVTIGHTGPPRSTPDFAALTTMCGVLGGMFNSRLNHQLREVKGYCYGIGADFEMSRRSGTFRCSTEVQTGVTVPALIDAVAEIERMHDDGLNEREVTEALAYQVGVFPIRLETPQAVAGALSTIVTYGLPDDYYTGLRSELTMLSGSELDAAAREHLHPDRLQIVVEGELSTFSDELSAAELAPITVLTDAELTAARS